MEFNQIKIIMLSNILLQLIFQTHFLLISILNQIQIIINIQRSKCSIQSNIYIFTIHRKSFQFFKCSF